VFLTGHADGQGGRVPRRHHRAPGSRASLGMVGSDDHLVHRVENLDTRIVVALLDLDQVRVARHDGKVCCGGLGSEGLQRACGHRGSSESTGARVILRGAWHSPRRQNNRDKKTSTGRVTVQPRLRCLVIAAYTRLMIGVDDPAAPAAMLPPKSDVPAPVADPVSHLTAVYRDYPGLRALILRRVRDPEAAADILQDAAVTTLEKLRSGEIAHPENMGGYLYRVALNHLRNHRRKDRTAVSSADALNELQGTEDDLEWERVGRPQWAEAARRMLDEMPAERDREILVRFYLNDEDKEQICRDLRLSEEHFNRVIFRARNRFRELLEHRGFWKADLLTLVAIGLILGHAGEAMDTRNSGTAPASLSIQDM
jgi:RNA polymerase sigma-70 factor (ECF subfamily)